MNCKHWWEWVHGSGGVYRCERCQKLGKRGGSGKIRALPRGQQFEAKMKLERLKR